MTYSNTADNGRSALSFESATGKMPFPLKNDYMFRAMLQSSNHALKGLIAALLHILPNEITSVEITNPVELGKSIGSKDFQLDIRILMNNNTIINMEMQVLNLGNWPERSLGYLCRTFDHLNSGQDYMETKSVIQICFLDFTLFRENPNFYTTYMFCDINSHTVYSDKLKLSIVDLTQIERATKEDIQYGIDHWARLFKATTWEELKMLAETSEFLKEASEAAYKLSAEEKIRLQCEAREDYYRQQRYIERRMRQLEEAEKKISENEQKLENLKQSLAATEQSLAATEQNLAKTEKILAEKDRQIEFMKEKLEQLTSLQRE